jgi:aspartate racemase
VVKNYLDKKIGIIGGLGPLSTADFYRYLMQLFQNSSSFTLPEVTLSSISLSHYLSIADDKKMVVDLFVKHIEALHDVDIVCIPCNTVHEIFNELSAATNVEIIPIFEPVIQRVLASGNKKVGIIGTSTTINSAFYQRQLEKYDIEYCILSEENQFEMNSIIYNKMLKGRGYDEMTDIIIQSIDQFKQQGCDGVILGCTEFPYFINGIECDIELFPSTYILAQEVFSRCTSE